MTTRRLTASLSWTRVTCSLPSLVAAAYVSTVIIEFPRLVHALYWDSDASSLPVLAERLRGHGPVIIPHFAAWTSLWWMLATRQLPGHVQLWEATGYAFTLAGAALLGWATARVAGHWPGMAAAAVCLVVGPFALRSQLTLTYHVIPPFTSAVLAAYLVTLPHKGIRVVPVAVGLLAGANAASDPLTWITAIAPFALAAGMLVVMTRRRDIAARAGMTAALAVGSAIATNAVMNALGFHVPGLAIRAAPIGDLATNVRQLARMVALLGGANYALPGGYPRDPIRIVLALLAVVAVSAALVLAVKAIARGDPMTRAYACFWAAAMLLLSLSFVGTTNATALGAGSMNYVLTLVLAAGAAVGILAARSRRLQVAASLAIAVVGGVNIAGIVNGRAGTPKGAIGTYERSLVESLDRTGVTRGYAGYWDASSLTWQSRRRVLVAPVSSCGRSLCAFNFFTIRSWYDEQRLGPSFLIVDPTTAFVTQPPPVVSQAAASYHFGPLKVYVFKYDLARHIRSPAG